MKGSGKGIAVVVVHIDVMHSWQNGTRCRNDVNVLCCRSHLVRLVFERSIPTYASCNTSLGNMHIPSQCFALYYIPDLASSSFTVRSKHVFT